MAVDKEDRAAFQRASAVAAAVARTPAPTTTSSGSSGGGGAAKTGNQFDPTFVRNAKMEADARAMGYSQAEIDARGGVNAEGYWGDVPAYSRLSAAEYKGVTNADGTINTSSQAALYQQKAFDYFKSQGMSAADAAAKASAGFGKYSITFKDENGNTVTPTSYDQGFGGGLTSAEATAAGISSSDYATQQANLAQQAAVTTERLNAWVVLKEKLDKFNLGSLADAVKQLILDGANTAEVTMKLRSTPEYQKRFQGNAQRVKSGFNVYDEATYLDLENAFDEAFAAYNQLGVAGGTAEQRQARYAGFIAGNKSAVEIKQRLKLAADVAQEDVMTKAALRQMYPMITDTDIASYFLDPEMTLPKLNAKVQAAQIGGAALKQGLVADTAISEELAAMGVTKEMAAQGYQQVASVLPKATFLSEISGTDKFTQQTAEDIYLKGLASEQRKLEKLTTQEANRFRGGAGTTRTSLSSKGSAGQV